MSLLLISRIVLPAVFLLAIIPAACGQVITRVTPTPGVTAPVARTEQVATQRPTATPAPYTPAPTATPTVTPTPVVYRVKGGDSLLGIAQQFGTTVQALQEANGIADPRTLQVGQQLVVPAKERPAAGTQTPTPAATPLPFRVENVNFQRSVLGGLWVLGEIENSSGQTLEQASVAVTLLDASAKPLGRVEAQAYRDLIPPGGRAPFAGRFTEAPQFASFAIEPLTGIQGFVGNYYTDLVVRDTRGEGERYAAYTVSGNLANTGPEDAVEVSLTVTLYDALGRVVGVRRDLPAHNVVPRGGETSFVVQVTPAGGPVTSFRVDAQGRRMPTPTPAK